MAAPNDAPLLTFQIAGFASVANGGNPALGTGLLASATLEKWPNGDWVIQTSELTSSTTSTSNGLTITLPGNSNRHLMPDNPQLNNLFDVILRGTNGLTSGAMSQDTAGIHYVFPLTQGS
ncbi:MAG: hypothetical protein KGI54_08340 [Pseudomonadota bacterium]|nr:hypothetical protein [Pseudomonadota bacterium]